MIEWKKLSEIAANTKFAIVDGPFGSSLKTSDYVSNGIPVLQGKNITGNRWEWKDIRFISEKKAEELKRSKVEIGDLLIVKIGSIGYSAIISDLNKYNYAIIPANLAKITINENKAFPKYIWRWLTSEKTVETLKGMASKTAQPALSLEKIKDLSIPLPPLPEQKRIAALLDEADRQRSLARQQLAEFDKLAEAVFVDMFGDPRHNFSQYQKIELSSIAHISGGVTLNKAKQPLNPISVPYLRVANVQAGYLDLGEVKNVTIDQSELNDNLLHRDDLLFTEGGDPDKLGRGVVWQGEVEPCIHQNHIFKARLFDPNYLPSFIRSICDSAYGKAFFLGKAKQTTGIASINATQLRSFPIPVVDMKLQQIFVERLAAIHQAKSTMKNDAEQAETLFQSLMHQSFGAQ